ncbi:MAG: dephospho-CoA kinase [Terracidiphilus sp.]|jgi:dephospho-CoA kinase
MLRVGLTGGLGSGKSTVAATLRALGAEVIEADELGRALMEPGQPVYSEIVRVFGPQVLGPDGRLNRARLAEMAFEGGRVNELNEIVHPAVIAAQRRWMDQVFARNPAVVAVVESALIFEVERDARLRGESETVLADWRRRIDRIVVVTAPDELKIARYAARVCPAGAGREIAEADARLRLSYQIPDVIKAARSDYILENAGDKEALRAQVEALWQRLQAESNKLPEDDSLK